MSSSYVLPMEYSGTEELVLRSDVLEHFFD